MVWRLTPGDNEMMSDKKREYRAWMGSVIFHLIVFAIISLSGLFVIVAPKAERPLDVAIYDMDAGGSSGSAGAAAPAPAELPPPTPSIDDVVIDQKKEKLPVIEEKFTKEPEKQEAFKKEHNAPIAPVANAVFAIGGTGDGSGSSLLGTGGAGAGAGDGGGTGNGGEGNGSGNGPASSQEKTKRPAIPPQLIAAPEPAYPENLRQKNINGRVTVRITVGTDGGVESAEIENSSGYAEMDAAALDAAWGYRYTTAYNEYGEAVSFRKRVRITFRLR